MGLKVFDRPHRSGLEWWGRFAQINGPGEIRSFAGSAWAWSRHAETGAVHRNALRLHELGNDFRQTPTLLAGVGFFHHAVQLVAFRVERGQSRAGSANVACENHGSIFLHCRPSRVSNSSDSAGPHVPEG